MSDQNTISKRLRITAISGVLFASMFGAAPAFADTDEALMEQLRAMQKQINELQGQIKELKKTASASQATAKTAAANAKEAQKTAKAASISATAAKEAALEPSAGSKSKSSTTKTADAAAPSGSILENKNVKITLGGYIEAAGIFRTRTETADMASSWGGIPLPNSSSYHLSEFRGSARQSRLSLLAEGKVDPAVTLAGYFESDFLGAAPTANSNESNSYTPRARQIYATMDDTDWHSHILAGQAWSMLTMNREGIIARKENVPVVIEAQYVPGFTWTRNPQARFVQDFYDKKVWAGISLESPQAIISNSSAGPFTHTPIVTTTGGSGFASTNAYSTDLAPDIIAKVAVDPGYGHYEIYGLARFFRDRTLGDSNHTIMGGGGGAAALLPIIQKKLDFQLSGLVGSGVGRYGSVQLPDITVKPSGGIATVQSMSLLAGLVGHPDEKWDTYLYAGTERARKRSFDTAGVGYGYGSGLYDNSGCWTEGSATCVGNTSHVDQITGGFWWKFYKGPFGTMQAGLQDSYTTRHTFSGVGGAPSTDDNITMLSLRYYPF